MRERKLHPFDRHLGERLRLARTLAGLSQSELAARLAVSFQRVQKYERGESRIGASRLFELARILGVEVAFFFEGLESAAPEASTSPAPGLADPGSSFVYDGPPAAAPAASRLDRRESLELLRAFNGIADPLVRRRLCELARALAALRYRR
ncbi:hypothetical protein HRbin40_01085 [bacterium HR40]|nr:hypothetical protein HRbin40_01085 [bacterium HR40]